tara:strand:- start:397 stop:627 length:231 start_codon:yes stop_codon:yes gene_type:complete
MNEIIDLEELEEEFLATRPETTKILEAHNPELTKVIHMEYILDLGERGIVKSFEWNDKDGLTLEMKPNWRKSIACL